MTSTAPSGGPTPPQEDQPNGAYASYVPHDLKYSAAFEDALMAAVLDSPQDVGAGIRVIPADSDEPAIAGVSVRTADVSLHSLPGITEEELPLALDDPRRIFASPVPGVKLTHPGGYLEGGPGLDPEMDTFPDDFLSNNAAITTPEQLRNGIQREVEASVALLKMRLRARREAKEKNEQVEKELRTLTDQHSMELKIHSRMAEDNRRKREAREKRRKEREGGE